MTTNNDDIANLHGAIQGDVEGFVKGLEAVDKAFDELEGLRKVGKLVLSYAPKKLILPYPPSANIYWRHNRGRTHRSREADAYIEHVGWICVENALQPATGKVCLSFDFYRPIKRGDIDNLLKVTIDALRGHAYVDDKQVVELHAMLHDDKDNPRAEVTIQVLP